MTDRRTGHGQSVMIIDDDVVTVDVFRHVLRGCGYEVRSAHDAESGFRDLVSTPPPPSALILDLHLPIANGLEFLRRCREHSGMARLPVVVVTGDYFIDDDTMAAISALGARVYFKPLWADDLVALVDELVNRARPDVT